MIPVPTLARSYAEAHWIPEALNDFKNVVKVEFHQWRSIFELLTLSTHIYFIISITCGEVGWAENHVEILCCADSLLFQPTVGHPTAPCHLPLWNLSQPARRQSLVFDFLVSHNLSITFNKSTCLRKHQTSALKDPQSISSCVHVQDKDSYLMPWVFYLRGLELFFCASLASNAAEASTTGSIRDWPSLYLWKMTISSMQKSLG